MGGPPVKYDIPAHAKGRNCRTCQKLIYFVLSERTGKMMPVNPDGSPHWANCNNADAHRKPRRNVTGPTGSAIVKDMREMLAPLLNNRHRLTPWEQDFCDRLRKDLNDNEAPGAGVQKKLREIYDQRIGAKKQ